MIGRQWKLRFSLLCDSVNREQYVAYSLANRITYFYIRQILRMWRWGLRVIQPLSILTADRAKVFWNFNKFKYTLIPIACTSIYYLLHHRDFQYIELDDYKIQQLYEQAAKNKIVETAKYAIRFIELGIIFTPSLLCLPLCLFDSTRGWWISIFLKAITKAGIVWIKAFQSLSHRRDVIGEQMAQEFQVLRQNSPQHTYKQTAQTIKRVYGKTVDEMFQQFNPTPIASGSVSQVYSAKLHGKKVAVKVRHPNASKNLVRDIDLMFKLSNFMSFFSKKFQIPITKHSLQKILYEQIMFLKEKSNLDKFNAVVNERNITFPKVHPQSTNEVLIEEFIQGKTIGFYQSNDHNMNKVIANIGAKAFFAMLMKYNLVHADCHAGNILVRIKEAPQLTARAAEWFNKWKNYIISQFIKYGFDSEFLRKLTDDHYNYQKDIQKLVDRYQERVEITLIDMGMAISLTAEKKKNLQSFLQQVIKGDPLQCAKWIYRISMIDGKPLKEFENQQYFNDLLVMFKRVHLTALESLQGLTVLREMLDVVRQHNVKIDGQISILLSNMLVLEAIAKDLDPNINILRCAIPFLQYKD